MGRTVSISRTSILVSCMLFGAVACQSDGATVPAGATSAEMVRGGLIAELAANTQVATPTDIDALEMDLPDEPRAIDSSDVALAAAIRASGGRAFIGLKAPESLAANGQVRMATDSMSASARQVRRGLRAALSASEAVAALNEVAGMGVEVLGYYERVGVAFVVLPPGIETKLRRSNRVDYVEPDLPRLTVALAYPALGVANAFSAVKPHLSHANDDFLVTQSTPWGVSLVRAPDAWAYSTGSTAKLLVVDTGHERGHEDLPVVPLSNCLGNYSGCSDPLPSYPTIPHGTHVTGSAVAQDNGVGVVGVAKGVLASNLFEWGACDDFGGCFTDQVIAAFNWAAANLGSLGVINLSLGGPSFSQPEANAVAAASAAGHVIVAAAGNTGSNQLRYPAAYSNVLGVAAVLPDKQFAATIAPCPIPNGTGSTWGNHVDFVGPWYALSTVTPNGYGDETTAPYWCGTSMASPHVAGTAALIRTRYPLLKSSGVYTRLRDTAEPLGPAGWDDHFGFGLVRAHLAVTFDRPTVTASIVSNKASLAWPAIPFASQYRIYRSVTPSLCPAWELWGSTTATTYSSTPGQVSSFYGYNSYPASQAAVSYAVTVVAEGLESAISEFSTFLPIGVPAC